MSEIRQVLDYAPPPERVGIRQIAKKLAKLVVSLCVLICFSVAGWALGSCSGDLAAALFPEYSSYAFVYVHCTDWSRGPTAQKIRHTDLRAIVATALQAAHKNSAGRSLPDSPASASTHVAINEGEDLTKIAYQSTDPSAARCMVEKLLPAYVAAVTLINPKGVTVQECSQPSIAERVADARPFLWGQIGIIAAIFLYWTIILLRRRHPAPTV